ncbi:hypothetical protein [Nocardioides sp. AE5]|uniref:hypothetical protein n=1 Tax=Nocardioides sp. AE5 TaxID=2962573 RepID=UPI0028811542|nr:hypothetical protein [Nocardioides sp. AE5]MDT0202429.1 hypothetical protein [Nocardioides sp. AE5]
MEDDSGLSDAQDAQVRRLLAQARHDEPMPPEVAARMDEVLAGLVAERAGASPTAPSGAPVPDSTGPGAALPDDVVPLHRRRWPRYLLAAAAVAAIGFGTFAVVNDSSDETSGSYAGRAASEHDENESGASQAPTQAPEDHAPDGAQEEPPMQAAPPPVLTDLDATSLAALETRVRDRGQGLVSGDEAERVGCGPGSIPDDARLVFAEHEDSPVLVVYTPQGEQTLAEVFECGFAAAEGPVASVVLEGGE